MIYLPDVALALEKILNNNFNNQNAENPTAFLFKVATAGFHLDNIYDKEEKKNFIPVFIDALGGNYDAVKNIKRAIKNITITFYFPVRFKNNFFAMDDFFVDNFVAEIVDFGGITGKCLCNISVPQLGEIQDLDLNQFKKWVDDIYDMPIEVMEPYMSMQFTLYLTTQSKGFLLGNSVEYTLNYTIAKARSLYFVIGLTTYSRKRVNDHVVDGTQYYCWENSDVRIYTKKLLCVSDEPYYSIEDDVVTEEGVGHGTGRTTEDWVLSDKLVWTSSGTGASNSPISQQLIDVDSYAKNVINITNYNKSIVAYIKDNEFWRTILDAYNNQELEKLKAFRLIKFYNFENGAKSYAFDQVALTLNENVALGDLISFTITFGDEYKEA